MELTLMDVQRALAKLLNHYPEAGHNSSTISRLSVDWFDLLSEEKITQKQFSAGMRHAVKTCRFFPKLVDVLDGVRVYRESLPMPIRSGALQIEDHTATAENWTPEEVERNKKRVRLITDALAGRLSWDDAERSVAEMGTISEFSSTEPGGQHHGGVR